MLTIQLLGSPQVTVDGRAIKLTRRKSRALVYYLAAHAQPIKRDHLLAFFWPDLPRSSAQQTLRTTLHGLRQALGSALLVQEDAVALAADTQVDARTFEQHLAPPASDSTLLASTLELYHGDFLSDFSLPDSSEFEDWATVEREHYRRLAIRGLAALGHHYEHNQDYAAALASLDRALALDPLQEDLQRESIRLLYLAGDRPGAIRRYDTLRKLLDEEMGVPPMVETRALYDAIISDTLAPPGGLPTGAALRPQTLSQQSRAAAQLPFAGRASEMQALRHWAFSQTHLLTLIEGEPGIGKSRLAKEFTCTADALCITGQARELEQVIPYQPIIEALRGLVARPEWPALRARFKLPAVWLAETARLLPELTANLNLVQPASSSADESRLWEGLNQFLLALARERRIILFLDDVQWADASTLGLLGYLIRQAEAAAAPILFLAATRPPEPRSPCAGFLQTLAREERLVRLPLARFTPDEVTSLAQRLSAAYAYPLATWLMQSAEGNPYVLSELVRHARENNILQPNGTLNLNAISASPIVPQTVYSLIQSRLARLSDAARRVLDAAVAAGREFDFQVVYRAAALSESAALDALDELRAAGLVNSLDEKRFAFDHHLTMEVAFREVGEARHRRLHRRVAEAMESIYRQRLDSVAGQLAWHFTEGDAPERAAPYAFRAGQLAAGLAAWKEAVAFYEQALDGETDDSQKVDIFMALGQARIQNGLVIESSEAFRAALRLAQSRQDTSQTDKARLGLGQSLLIQARYEQIIALARQVLAGGYSDHACAAEIMWGAALSLEGADLAGAIEHLKRAEAYCGDQRDLTSLARVKFEMGGVAAQQSDLPQAIALYREALAIARDADETALIWHILSYNNLAYHLHLMGDPTAIEYAEAGLKLAREKGALPLLTYLLSTLGEIALARGDLEAAEAYFSDGLAMAEQFSIPERIAGLTANLGRVAQQKGQAALAIHRLSTALARADTLGTQHLAAQIRVWLAPLLPPAEACTHLTTARAIAESGHRRRLLDEISSLERQLSA